MYGGVKIKMTRIYEISFFFVVAIFAIIQMVYFNVVGDPTMLAQALPTPTPDDVNSLIKLGPWGIVLIMAIKMIIDYLQKGKEDQKIANKVTEAKNAIREGVLEIKTIIEKIDAHNDKSKEELHIINNRISELYNWHNIVDDDNVKIWYIRKSFTDAILKISDNSEETNKLFLKMAESLERMSEILYVIREHQTMNEKSNDKNK